MKVVCAFRRAHPAARDCPPPRRGERGALEREEGQPPVSKRFDESSQIFRVRETTITTIPQTRRPHASQRSSRSLGELESLKRARTAKENVRASPYVERGGLAHRRRREG